MKKVLKKILKRLILLLLLVGLCFSAFLITSGYALYKEATKSQSVAEKVLSIRRNEDYVTLEEIPDIYEEAVISAEDRRFYKHIGVDFSSMLRALFANLKSGEFSQGGSTITQQLAKNMFFTHEKSLARKAAELFVVYQLEDDYAKDVILELYINTVYYGDGYYCIKDAAKGYFNCSPEEMSDYECTLLAGVPNAPSVYAPSKNREVTKKRHEYVLDSMVKTKAITKAEKERILKSAGND